MHVAPDVLSTDKKQNWYVNWHSALAYDHFGASAWTPINLWTVRLTLRLTCCFYSVVRSLKSRCIFDTPVAAFGSPYFSGGACNLPYSIEVCIGCISLTFDAHKAQAHTQIRREQKIVTKWLVLHNSRRKEREVWRLVQTLGDDLI